MSKCQTFELLEDQHFVSTSRLASETLVANFGQSLLRNPENDVFAVWRVTSCIIVLRVWRNGRLMAHRWSEKVPESEGYHVLHSQRYPILNVLLCPMSPQGINWNRQFRFVKERIAVFLLLCSFLTTSIQLIFPSNTQRISKGQSAQTCTV